MTELEDFRILYMHTQLLNAGLPIVSVRLDKTYDWGIDNPTIQQINQATIILVSIDLNIIFDTDKSNLVDEYQNAITRLEQIRDYNLPTITQTLIINAFKDIARILILLLKFIKRILV